MEPKVIRANQFVLEDDKGTPRAMLGVSNDGSMLALCDKNGTTLISLTVSNDESSLRLSDDNGKTRVVLDVGNDGVPGMALLHGNGVRMWSKP